MPRRRHEPQRSRWLIPTVLSVTAVVATAGVYFWNEMENDEAAAGFRSEDEQEREAHRGRNTPTSSSRAAGLSSGSRSNNGNANGKGIGERVGDILKGFFDGSSSEDESGRSSRASQTRTVAAGASGGVGRGAGAGAGAGGVVSERRDMGQTQTQMNWDQKRVVALVISSLEELEESVLLQLPTPLDLSRCILLIFIYTPPSSPLPSLTPLSPRPIPHTPSKNNSSASPAHSVTSDTYSVKSFARTQSSPPLLSADSSPSLHPAIRTPMTSGRTSRADGILDDADEDEDLLATPTPMNRYGRKSLTRTRSGRAIYAASDSDSEATTEHDLPSLITKTFGKDFPSPQVMHYSTPVAVVHMLRHLGVSIVFLSESCASTNPSAISDDDATHAPPAQATSGGEIVNMLRDWVGEIVLILDEDEDDSGPSAPSAVSGGEDEYTVRNRKKGKERKRMVEGTGRKRKWLDKEKGVGKSVTVVERARLGGVWRTRVEGR